VCEGGKPSYTFSNLFIFIKFIMYSNQLVKLYNFTIFHDFYIIILSLGCSPKIHFTFKLPNQVQGLFFNFVM